MAAKNVRKKYKIDSRKWPGVYGYDSAERTVNGKTDTCYYVAYRAGGRLVWEKVGWRGEGLTPQIAAEIRAERVRKARHGEVVKTAKEIAEEKRQTDRTVNEIAEKYFDSARGQNLKGRVTDLNRFEKHIRPVLGERRVSSLAPLDINRIEQSMKGKATATFCNALELLRRLINFGAENKFCPRLEFTIKLPKKNNERVEYLTPEEADRFVKVLDTWRYQGVARMLKLAMVTGLRRGEIFGLEDQDLDFQQGLIMLRDPKGGEDASVPMNTPAREIFELQIAWRNRRYPDSTYIFPGRGGKRRVDCSGVKRIKAEAELPKRFRIFHGLRHHFAVTLANSGEFSLDMIGELLTHKSVLMTRRYGQFLPGTVKKASDRAADLIQQQIRSSQEDNVVELKK